MVNEAIEPFGVAPNTGWEVSSAIRSRPPIAAASLALALAACSEPDTSSSFEAEINDQASYVADVGTGISSATIETSDGPATLRSGARVPVELTAGFTLFPDAEVLSNTSFSRGESRGALLVFQTKAEPDVVVDYYRGQAAAAGIAIELDMAVDPGRMIGGQDEAGTRFSLSVDRDGETTTGQLLVGFRFGS